MADLITMPKLGFDMAEGTLVQWVKKAGDVVAEGQVIAIIETDKANVEVTSFKAGTLLQLLVEEGAIVPINQPIAVIGEVGESVDMAALGVAAPKTEPKAKPQAAAAQAQKAPAPLPPVAAETGRIVGSPVALRMAQELGIDLRQVQGSGPGGRIIKRDIEAHLKAQTAPKPAAMPITIPSQAPTLEEYRAMPLTPMRQTIARRMTESKQQVPHFYITMSVDMQAAMSLRKQLNALLPEGESISVTDLLIKAAAMALKEFPNVNASFAGNEIHIHNQVNIGIAVAREAGLVTTVLRDCDRKTLAQIARESRELIARARQGRMRAEEMIGGTFNISNLGMYGVDDFIAIISPPQAAALAVGAVQRVPVVNEQGEVVAGNQMKVTISADHRVTDGAEAADMLRTFKQILEQPLRLLL